MSRKDSKLGDFAKLLLAHPSLHCNEIAEKLGVARQVVYKYPEKLAKYGVRVEKHKHNPRVPLGHLSIPEEDKAKLRTSADLIGLSLGDAVVGYELFERVLYSPHEDYMVDGLLSLVAQAIAERRVANVIYLNAKGEEKPYRYNAYRVAVSGRRLHLLGIDHNTLYGAKLPNVIQRRRLDMIAAFELTDETFTIPADVDVEMYANQAFAYFDVDEGAPDRTIRIRFSADKAFTIARTQRHITQTEVWQDDGSIVWQAKMPLGGELVSWIVGYGGMAEVLEPPELRERVRAFAMASLKSNS